MEKRGAKIKIDEYKGPLGTIKGFELTTGKISYGDETEWEPMGPQIAWISQDWVKPDAPHSYTAELVFYADGAVWTNLYAYLWYDLPVH